MEGCPGVSATRAAMRVHFVHRHVHNTVVILEEGNLLLPRCPRCDLQVSRKALKGRHMETSPLRRQGARGVAPLVHRAGAPGATCCAPGAAKRRRGLLETSQCRTGTERKRRRLAEAELEITSEKAFHAYGKR